MFKSRRKHLSQNFLHSRKLVADLVARFGINPTDVVLEIGPGKGIITHELVKRAKCVIAVELDHYWYEYLQQKFSDAKNLSLHSGDFLKFSLPNSQYKVFANLPFSIEGKIIRQLIESANPPVDCSVIILDKLAKRLAMKSGANMFLAMHRPWFDFSIEHYFKPADFRPIPKVSAALFRFSQLSQPLLPWGARIKYREFVQRGYGSGLSVRVNL